MKKHISSRLEEVAKSLPLIFEWTTYPEKFYGWELNLTPLKEKFGKFEKDKVYEYPMPALRAVEHHQQLKDAYKNKGIEGVETYYNNVMDKAMKLYGNDNK